MNVLFLSRWFPDPPDNGSKLRIYHLLRGLSAEHKITLISFYDPDEGAPQLAELQHMCTDVRLVPWKEPDLDRSGSWISMMRATPRYYSESFSHAMRAEIIRAVQSRRFERVVASQIDMAAYAPYFGRLPALFEEAETGTLFDQYLQAESADRRLRYRLTWIKHCNYVRRLSKNFRACTVASERERKLFLNEIAAKVTVKVVPNGVDLASYAGGWQPPVPNSMVFTGAFTYSPNYDGMLWFLKEVYPLLKKQAPGTSLTITGNHAGLTIPTSDGVNRTGYVDDVRPYIAGALVDIVPIQQGGGTRLKILEAMAIGTPVVTTRKGAEGLDVQDGVHLLLADQPKEFMDAVLRLFQQPELRKMLASNARNLVQQKYDWSCILPGFLELVKNIGYN